MWFSKGLQAIVAASIAFTGCQFNKQYVVTQSQLEKSIEDIVTEGINLFNEGKIQEAQALLEEYREKNTDSFTAPAHTLLALCYVDRINLSNLKKISAEITKEFEALNNKFLDNPLTLLEIQKRFVKLFETEGYQRIERKIQRGIVFEPALYGALFILHLSQERYESARDYAKRFVNLKKFQQLPNPEEVINKYRIALSEISGDASRRNDYNRMIGCARVSEAFLIELKR